MSPETPARRSSQPSDFDWMRDQLYSLFREAFGGSGPESGAADPAWQPAVDVVETATAVEIRIDLAGLSDDEVTVERRGDRLVVKAEWVEESLVRDRRREETERSRRGFERSFRVPEGLDADSFEASCSHGLLSITLRKVP